MSSALSATPQPPGEVPGVDASLGGTMGAMQVLTQMQAKLSQQAQERAAAVSSATDAANRAGIQYGQAAAAPPPEVNPLAKLITGMGGDVASIMSKNPVYGDRAHSDIDQMHADLVANRVQNLQSLRDQYSSKAQLAAQLGNTDIQLKSTETIASIDKALDQILERQREAAALRNTQEQGKNTLAVSREQGANQIATERVKGEEARKTLEAQMNVLLGMGGGSGAGDAGGTPNPFILHDKLAGVDYVTLQDGATPKMKQALTNLARKRTAEGTFTGILNPKETAILKNIDNVQAGLASVFEDAKSWLPKSATDPGRWTMGVRGLTDPAISTWGANRLQAVSQLSAMISAGTGGRMNQKMIDLAIQNDIPTLGTDPLHPSDWQASSDLKFQRANNLFSIYRKTLLGVPGAVEELQKQIAADSRSAPNKQPGAKAPAAPVDVNSILEQSRARAKARG